MSYKENFPGEPTGKDNPELLRMHPSVGHAGAIVNGVPRIGFQKGGKAAQWKDEDMAELFLEKAKGFVRDHKDKPFFLYYGLHQPHVPRVPNQKFVGKSGMGPRGDVILEADWCVTEFLKELDKQGLTENTLIIFTSDNGPVLDDGYQDQAVELVGDHKMVALCEVARPACMTEGQVFLSCCVGRRRLNRVCRMRWFVRWIYWLRWPH